MAVTVFWLIMLRAAGYGAWPQLAGWFEQRAAQVLQQAQAVGGHGQPRQPRDARSRTAHTRVRQLVSPGSRPMTLTLLRVSPLSRYRDNGDYAGPVIMPRCERGSLHMAGLAIL